MSGDPMRGRKMRGIPRGGDLYVNGEKVAKGNLPHQVRRVHKGMRTDLAKTSQLGPYQFVAGADLDDPICHGCHLPVDADSQATRERATGHAWHMGTSCMSMR